MRVFPVRTTCNNISTLTLSDRNGTEPSLVPLVIPVKEVKKGPNCFTKWLLWIEPIHMFPLVSLHLPGSWSAVRTALGCAAAGFAFGETALVVAFESPLTEDGPLLTAAARAAARVGPAGVGAVAACLAFASALVSLGSGFHLAAAAMRLSARVDGGGGGGGGGGRSPWFTEACAVGPSIVAGAVAPGVLGAVVPAWVYAAAHCALVVAAYSSLNVNEMTVALSIVFVSLYFSVACGRCGVVAGACCMGATVAFCCALRRALTERLKRAPGDNGDSSSYRMFDRMMLYSIVVAVLGFLIGLGTTGGEGERAEVASTLDSVVWVGLLAAGTVGSALGTVVAAGLGPDGGGGAGRVAAGAAATSSLALRLVLPALAAPQGRAAAALGAAAAAGVSLGSAGVAAKAELGSRGAYLGFSASVVAGVILATRVLASTNAPLPLAELATVSLVAVGAFILGAPQSPFHIVVNMSGGRVAGPDLLGRIAAEAVSGAAAPLGAGVLGAAALGMAALGRLGTLGVLLAAALAVGRTLKHRDP